MKKRDGKRKKLGKKFLGFYSHVLFYPVTQVPSLDNLNSDVLHQWEQSLALKPAVLTTDLTLVPIYELVDDEDKRNALRTALDDLLAGELKVKR